MWKPTNRDEIWLYLTLSIMMGITKKPEYPMYWTTDHINCLLEKFQSNYTPDEHLAIDEYLSLWKGRLSFKIYIPTKRERYGVKIYMLCESAMGYIFNFIIYTGGTTEYINHIPSIKDFENLKSPTRIVLSLLSQYVNKGYCVSLDNYYMSPELAKGLPKDFWSLHPEKGEVQKKCDDEIMVLRWNDITKTKSEKIVSMLSTIHKGDLIDSGKRFRGTDRPVMKPDVIVDYNKTMGGVDLLSRVLIPYSIQRPSSKKWYCKLGELFFEMCIYNAFILWKKLNVNNTDHLKFRKILVEELITFHSYGGVANLQTGSRHSNRVGNPLRLIEKHFISVIPSTSSKKRSQKPCVRHRKMCMRRDTMYWCKICQVRLCLEECFEVYHTKTDITKSISDVAEESFEESFQEYFEVSYEEEEVEAHARKYTSTYR